MTRFALLSATAWAVLASAAQAQSDSGAISFTVVERMDINDSSGAPLGVLGDVVVSQTGQIVQLLIGEGGVLGLGETLRVLEADSLPPIVDGEMRLDGQSAESIAALPVYQPPRAPEAGDANAPPPVSGANQQAPQSATSHIPVSPNAVRAEPVPAGSASTPPPPAAMASADAAQVEEAPSAEHEKGAAGSGSSGMAPQQGTGTGATQATPSANEGGGQDDGGASGTSGAQNEQYGRDRAPANQPMPENSSGRATADARAPEASVDLEERRKPAENTAAEPRWRLGEIVGAPVLGDRDGLHVEDVRFSGGVVDTAVIARDGEADVAVPFTALNIGGAAEDPDVALRAPLGSSALPATTQ